MAVTRCLVGVLLIALVASGKELGVRDIKEPLSMDTSLKQVHPFVAKLMNNNTMVCEFCEEIVDFLYNVTTDPDTLNGIETLLLSLCEYAPFEYHNMCVARVKSVPDMIKKYAKEYLNAAIDCAALCGKGEDLGGLPDAMNVIKLMSSMQQKKRPEY